MKNKGITLVALVVTIVIMLILVGVTLNIALGDNGLFKMTRQAVNRYKTAQGDEEEAMQDLSDEIYGLIGKGKDDKTPGEITGEGTEEKPFLIESIEDLVEFSNKVNAGTTYENQIVKLAVNLDFQSEDSYVDSKTKTYGDINGANGTEDLKTELTTEKGFKSIGNDKQQFKGTFDGQNRTISNLYINVAENYKGLFGYVGSKGSIKNLTISNANINCEGINVGTIVGYANEITIENIRINKGTIIGNCYVGGIAGRSVKTTIDNCINNGEIIGNGVPVGTTCQAYVGGIVGDANSTTITNSHNSNKVYSKRGFIVGGITGKSYDNSNIFNCYNEGLIGVLEKDKIIEQMGGISGSIYNNSKILKCYNTGDIVGKFAIGGIVGNLGWNYDAYIEDCYNTGTVTAIEGRIGGICYVDSSTTGSSIKNCYNIGKVNVTEPANSYIRKYCSDRG